jgi:predicted phosphohydrolase
LKFVAISDTHCRHQQVKLPPGDVILHAGDVTYKGEKSEVLDFLQWFSRLPYKHKIFIAGNHDFYFEKAKPAEIEALIPPGVTYLFDNDVIIDGIKIWGSPVTPWFFNWAFNRKRGAPIRKHWDKIPADTDIILTHGPAYGMHDLVINNTHTGCVDLLKTIETIKPKVHVCGHIHEGYGKTRRAGTTFINASLLTESYALMNRPIPFEV